MPRRGEEESEESPSSSESSEPSDEETDATFLKCKPKDGKKDARKSAKKKRSSPRLAASSSKAPQSSHLSKQHFHAQGKESPSKLARRDRSEGGRRPLQRSDAMDCDCDGPEHVLNCPFQDLSLNVEDDENAGTEPSVSERASRAKRRDHAQSSSSSSVPGAAKLGQSMDPSLLSVPGPSPKVKTPSPSKVKRFTDFVVGKLSPKRRNAKGSSSDKTDPKSKQKPSPQFKKPPPYQTRSVVASGSGSSSSKKTSDSSFDSSLHSTSASDSRVVEPPRRTTRRGGSLSTATGGDSGSSSSDMLSVPRGSSRDPSRSPGPRSPGGMLGAPAGSEQRGGGSSRNQSRSPGPRSSGGMLGAPAESEEQRRRGRSRARSHSPRVPLSSCTCKKTDPDKLPYDHKRGCPLFAFIERKINNRSSSKTYKHPDRKPRSPDSSNTN